MSYKKIAKILGIDPKTVKKAVLSLPQKMKSKNTNIRDKAKE